MPSQNDWFFSPLRVEHFKYLSFFLLFWGEGRVSSFYRYEFEQTLGDDGGQRSLACSVHDVLCSWGHGELDATEQQH